MKIDPRIKKVLFTAEEIELGIQRRGVPMTQLKGTDTNFLGISSCKNLASGRKVILSVGYLGVETPELVFTI